MNCLSRFISKAVLTLIVSSFGIILVLASCGPTVAGPGSGVESAQVGFSANYSYLNDWGGWRASARFGNVWSPSVGSDWTPFSNGQWVWTDQGWLWSSDEPYGWLVYHYGNWYYDDQLGWCWVPGDSWSPATVKWVNYGNYVCWAPVPPRGASSWPDPWQTSSVRYWNVVRVNDFSRDHIVNYRVDRSSLSAPEVRNKITVVRNAPNITVVRRTADRPLVLNRVNREPTVIGKRTFYKATAQPVQLPAKFTKKDVRATDKNKQDDKKPKRQGSVRPSGDQGNGHGEYRNLR